jgi:CheY-like chemotaxis protein
MKNILIVDDDAVSNLITKKTIEYMFAAVNTWIVQNGRQALHILERHTTSNLPLPEVIFLDLDMPIMNGFEFLKAFNDLELPGKENIRVIVLSSSGDPIDIQQAAALGIQEFIMKPLNEKSLRKVLPH